jgi:hypothetical protein
VSQVFRVKQFSTYVKHKVEGWFHFAYDYRLYCQATLSIIYMTFPKPTNQGSCCPSIQYMPPPVCTPCGNHARTQKW